MNGAPRDLPPDPGGWNPLLGFGTFARKELLDWWNSRRSLVVFGLMTLIVVAPIVLGPPNPGRPPNMTLEELAANRVTTPFQQWQTVVIFLILAGMGLLVTEKVSGTLAWNLTKPLSRTAVLAGKWAVATF